MFALCVQSNVITPKWREQPCAPWRPSTNSLQTTDNRNVPAIESGQRPPIFSSRKTGGTILLAGTPIALPHLALGHSCVLPMAVPIWHLPKQFVSPFCCCKLLIVLYIEENATPTNIDHGS